MAVKKKLEDGYSYEDLFDTQEALDNGVLGMVSAGTTTTYERGTGFLNKNEVSGNGKTSDWMANAGNFASILGKTDAIAANKKRKKEQTLTGANGFGSSNSILGGGGF